MTSARTWLRTERKDTGYPAECQARIDQYDLGDHQSGKVRFKMFEGGMNASILIDFLKRLVKDANRKVILILDNLRVQPCEKGQGLAGR